MISVVNTSWVVAGTAGLEGELDGVLEAGRGLEEDGAGTELGDTLDGVERGATVEDTGVVDGVGDTGSDVIVVEIVETYVVRMVEMEVVVWT